jgi:hypothetical protein
MHEKRPKAFRGQDTSAVVVAAKPKKGWPAIHHHARVDKPLANYSGNS